MPGGGWFGHYPEMTSLGSESPSERPEPVAPPESTSGWRGAAVLGALLGVVAAVLTVVGSFIPLFAGEARAAGHVLTMTVTGWDFSATGGPKSGAAPVTGVPLSLAAGVLLVAAVAGFAAASRRATAATKRLAGALCGVATAFLAGVVATVATQVASWDESFEPADSPAGAVIEYSAGPGVGFWLLLGAVVLALPTAFLALRGGPAAALSHHGSVPPRGPEA